jgi:hypothetical protein
MDGGAGEGRYPAVPDGGRHDDPSADGGAADISARANGTVSAWVLAVQMPLPRANHCSAVVGDRLVVIGGSYRDSSAGSFVKTALVHVADVHEDGSLGGWNEAGTTPSPVTECSATASGARLIVIDGI